MNEKTIPNIDHDSTKNTIQADSSAAAGGSNTRPLIEVSGLDKVFTVGRVPVNALSGISLSIYTGEFVTLQGASGAGKSTLLHLMGGLERATSGSITISGKNLLDMSEDDLSLFRKDNVGFVFQFFNLIPTLTAVENVMVSHMFDSDAGDEETWKHAVGLLTQMGLKHRMNHRPSELSGGEQQRVAIARALLNRPGLLLADEPTGNIDSDSGKEIMKIFKSMNKDGMTVIVATHNNEIAKYADRILHMKDGKLVSD